MSLLPPPRVLLVDHRLSGWAWLRVALHDLGATVTEAGHGDQALDLAASELPDVVIVGVAISGLDGFEVVRRLSGEPHTAHLPVLMAAAGGAEPLPSLEAGALRLIQPPAPRRETAALLANAVRLKRAAEAARERLLQAQQWTADRDRLVRLTLADLQSLHAAAQRAATALVGEIPAGGDVGRYARAIAAEVQGADQVTSTLLLIRRLEEGDWTFQPRELEFGELVAAALAGWRGPAVDASLAPHLRLVADRELLLAALRALLRYGGDRLEADGRLGLTAAAPPGGGVHLELRATGAWRAETLDLDAMQSVLQLTLASLVAAAHGGQLHGSGAAAPTLTWSLPPEPSPSATWPPQVSRAAPAAGGSAATATTAAAATAAARRGLPAPASPPRLPPPRSG
ncbi:MAG: response regulator [Fimbriimonadaceae bacterium]|nr:response regulator [Fimbriimonadaceae bacterium]